MSLPIKQGQKVFSTPQSLKLQIKPCVPAQKMHSHIQQFKGLYLRTMSRDTFNKSKKAQIKKKVIKIFGFDSKNKVCKYIVGGHAQTTWTVFWTFLTPLPPHRQTWTF